MDTATLTSKGQLVIPKRIRDAVRARPGTKFVVRLDGARIILEVPRPRTGTAAAWQPLNPKGVRLSTRDLCAPVALSDADVRD